MSEPNIYICYVEDWHDDVMFTLEKECVVGGSLKKELPVE